MPVLVCACLLLGACTQSRVYYGAQSETMNRKRILLLRPSLLAPTPSALHARVVQQVTAEMDALPDVGELVTLDALRRGGEMPLDLKDAYDQYSNTLSLTGVSDPDLARKLQQAAQVDLLALAQPAYLPCAVCEDGDQLWLVGQIVDAHTGRLVFRAHFSEPAPSNDAAELNAVADELMADYLDALALAFKLRPHRTRFSNLKAKAAG